MDSEQINEIGSMLQRNATFQTGRRSQTKFKRICCRVFQTMKG